MGGNILIHYLFFRCFVVYKMSAFFSIFVRWVRGLVEIGRLRWIGGFVLGFVGSSGWSAILRLFLRFGLRRGWWTGRRFFL